MLRSSGEYGRIVRDPIFRKATHGLSNDIQRRGKLPRRNAFLLPLFLRDEIVRDSPWRTRPFALTSKAVNSGATTYSAAPAGGNLIAAANAEYRVHLSPEQKAQDLRYRFRLATPQLACPARPLLLSSQTVTSRSAGIELRWTIPGVQVPFRPTML